jgi:peptidoglycan hydrolase-like protein with peptidoglycan-binding domain
VGRPAEKRSRFIAAAVAVAVVCFWHPPRPAAAASSGGTAPRAAPSGSSSAGSGRSGGTEPGSPSAATGGSKGAAKAPAKGAAKGGAKNRRASGHRASNPHVRSIRITSVSCTPASKCSGNPHVVSRNGTLLVGGIGLKPGMVVAFPSSPGARISRISPGSRLRLAKPGKPSAGLIVTVPGDAHSGRIMVLLGGGRYTSSYGPISVVAHAIHPPAPPRAPAGGSGAVRGSAFEGQGMWIWYVSKSDGGSVASIAAQAHAAGVTTVLVKSSDGSTNYWEQFSPALVQELHANGLKVCAWQYVYGSDPAGEAELGARAVANGADCLVIDAEAEYEGRYAAAQTYIADLRAKIGTGYPLGLASFPYVSYHPTFPYSVFLGPNGAQFNLPQMYWKAIGQSVDTVYANTYIANRIYGRPIFPLGQTYEGVSAADLLRFREEAVDYGASGLSFWDWQETSASGWSTLAAPLAPLSSVTPNASYPELHEGSRGDQVLWMQEHLASAIPAQPTSGEFGAQTTTDLLAFQTAHGIPASGLTDTATWQALLALPPVAVDWTGGGPKN